jgi:hypothetical protein
VGAVCFLFSAPPSKAVGLLGYCVGCYVGIVITPAIAKLHAEAVELQADALAETTQAKYEQ